MNKKELINKNIEAINKLGYRKNLSLTSKDVAKILGTTTSTLDIWRRKNIGPKSKPVVEIVLDIITGQTIKRFSIYTKYEVAVFLVESFNEGTLK